MTKTILVLAIVAIFIAGASATIAIQDNMTLAAKPPVVAGDVVCTGCVGSTDIANAAITNGKLASSIFYVRTADGSFGVATVQRDTIVFCDSGDFAVSGGYSGDFLGGGIYKSANFGNNGWHSGFADGTNTLAFSGTHYAICVDMTP